MKRLAFIFLLLAVVTARPVAQTQTAQRIPDTTGTAAIQGMLDMYCMGCHSTTARAGGVAFSEMPLEAIGGHAETWEKAVRKLRGRLMPPPGSRQPSQAEVDSFIHSLEDAL